MQTEFGMWYQGTRTTPLACMNKGDFKVTLYSLTRTAVWALTLLLSLPREVSVLLKDDGGCSWGWSAMVQERFSPKLV